MRKLILSFVLATAGAVGLTATQPARAYDDGRIFVSIGDVAFSYGRPYHRHSRAPLYVVQESWGPRYYYNAPVYSAPVYAPRYYAPPPPPRYYSPVRYDRPYAHGYRDGYRHHDRHDRYDRRRDDHRRHRDYDRRYRDRR